MPDVNNVNTIHATAIIEDGAKIGTGVSIGAYSVIAKNVEVGDGCRIASHVVIEGPCQIGKNNEIYQFASVGAAPQDKKYNGEPTLLLIGDNNVIREGATLNRGTVQGGGSTTIGSGNLIMAYVHVAHDCHVGNRTILANNTALAGHVNIHDDAILGGFSLVHQFCTVGSYAFTAMNSVISKNVPPYLMISGHMAKPHGLNLEGLKRNGFDKDTIRQLKDAYKFLYRSGLTLDDAITEIIALAAKCPEVEVLVDFLKENVKRGIIR